MNIGSQFGIRLNSYAELQVQRYFNPIYNILFLNEATRLFKINRNELDRYYDEFTRMSEVESPDMSNLLKQEETFLTKLQSTDELSSTFALNQTISSMTKPLDVIYHIMYNRYKSYELESLFSNNRKCIVFLDFHGSNTESLSEYFQYQELRKELRGDAIPVSFRGTEQTDNIYFLKVLIKSDKSEDSYRTLILNELEKFDDFLKENLLTKMSKIKSTNILPFKDIVFLTDNKGNISYSYFRPSVVKQKYEKILNETINRWINDNSRANIQAGIQKKKNVQQLFINPFFSLKFKDINRETNLLNTLKQENKDLSSVKTVFKQVYFLHFILNEILKEFFDAKYLHSKQTHKQAEQTNYLTIYFHYNLKNEQNDYEIKKIVFNTNFLYTLEISELNDVHISGYFLSRGKFYSYRITELNVFNKSNALIDIINYLFKKRRSRNNEKTFLSSFLRLFLENPIIKSVNKPSNIEISSINVRNKLSFYKFLYDGEVSDLSIQDEDMKEYLLNVRNEIISSDTDVVDILYFIYASDDIKLRLDKQQNIYKLSVLEKHEKSRMFRDKFFGILKRYTNIHYYESFTINRINKSLPSHKKIGFYDDLYITSKSLSHFISSNVNTNTSSNKNKERDKDDELGSKLLEILDSAEQSDELFDFTYNNYKSHIYISETYENKNTDSIAQDFKLKVIQGLIKILFKPGTPFYITNNAKTHNSSTSKMVYSSYVINQINSMFVILDKITEEDLLSKVSMNHFKDRNNKYQSNVNNDPLITNIEAQQETDNMENNGLLNSVKGARNEKYAKYSTVLDKVTKRKDKNENIVLIDFDLVPKTDFKNTNNCKSRKNRIHQLFKGYIDGAWRQLNLKTRKLRNKLKTNRLLKRRATRKVTSVR